MICEFIGKCQEGEGENFSCQGLLDGCKLRDGFAKKGMIKKSIKDKNMTDQQKLQAIVQKAVDNGFKIEKLIPSDVTDNTDGYTVSETNYQFGRLRIWVVKNNVNFGNYFISLPDLICNDEFMKALYGGGEMILLLSAMLTYKYHQQQAIISDNIADYLYETAIGGDK